MARGLTPPRYPLAQARNYKLLLIILWYSVYCILYQSKTIIATITITNDKGKELQWFNYPGGELNFNYDEGDDYNKAVMVNNPRADDMATDLIKLSLWGNYCRKLSIRNTLIMGYIPAARADRGVPFGAEAYIKIINGADIDEVIVLDPHSPVSVELLNNAKVANLTELMSLGLDLKVYDGIIAPDEGSIDRAMKIANMLNIPIYFGIKKRDFATGRILDYSIDLSEASPSDKLLVVDDICDGGGTFNYLSEISKLPKDRLDLWVTHGVFSGEASTLLDNYANIYNILLVRLSDRRLLLSILGCLSCFGVILAAL